MEKSETDVRALRRQLLNWYRRHHRDLPWRSATPDPYHVLVSEAMLQQTQVATVIDYYRRFIERFPTARALAEADEQAVLRLWQGLGYYRRARHLHAAAKAIVEQHDGNVPDHVEGIVQLPGVGRYTAAAVASIAFGRQAAVLDGNVARVLARWFAIDESIDDAPVKAKLWDIAESLVPRRDPGDHNQAMMELGALVCTPRTPGCLTCPVASLCEANAQGRVDELPVRRARRKPTAVTHHVVAVSRRGKWLFEQRPATGLWSNMWQLPTAESLDDDDLAAWLQKRFGLTVDRPRQVDRFTHQTTHRTIGFVVWQASAQRGRLARGVWRHADDVDDLPLAKPQQMALAAIAK